MQLSETTRSGDRLARSGNATLLYLIADKMIDIRVWPSRLGVNLTLRVLNLQEGSHLIH
jgi:hypothetical protein